MNPALIRTQGGTMVHRSDCPLLDREPGDTSSATPWLWASGRGLDEIKLAMAMVGSRPCPYCRPTFPR